jgi:hypothetical protein
MKEKETTKIITKLITKIQDLDTNFKQSELMIKNLNEKVENLILQNQKLNEKVENLILQNQKLNDKSRKFDITKSKTQYTVHYHSKQIKRVYKLRLRQRNN